MHTLTLLLPAPPAAGPTAIVRAEALPVDACMLVFAAAAANKTSLNMDLQQLYPLRVSLSHETVSTHFTPFKRWFVRLGKTDLISGRANTKLGKETQPCPHYVEGVRSMEVRL